MTRSVSPWVRDLVVLALWIPPILILVAVGIGAVGVAIQIAQGQSIPLGSVTDALPPSMIATGAAVAVGYLYLILANETFGTETVEAAQDQAEDAQEDMNQ